MILCGLYPIGLVGGGHDLIMLAKIIAAFSLFLGLDGSNIDDQFLAALRSHGIVYVSPEWAVWDGYQVCADLGAGASPGLVAQWLMQQTTLDQYHAGFFVGASIAAYCPQYE